MVILATNVSLLNWVVCVAVTGVCEMFSQRDLSISRLEDPGSPFSRLTALQLDIYLFLKYRLGYFVAVLSLPYEIFVLLFFAAPGQKFHQHTNNNL